MTAHDPAPDADSGGGGGAGDVRGRHDAATERRSVLLRLDLAVHDALARWAGDEFRSTNAQIEFLLRRALADAGRLPGRAGPMRPRGRPPAGRQSETSPPAHDDDRSG